LEGAAAVTIVGGGLAGCEAALQLARYGVRVVLHEMKPARRTPAQRSDDLAELVCSNSLRSSNVQNAVGLLKEEMRRLGSFVIAAADATRVPAGDALAVDRDAFAKRLTEAVRAEPLIELRAGEVAEIPSARPLVIATGPLTSDALAARIRELTGATQLYFYDSIAPIVDADSIDESRVFRASRYGKGDGDDYVNCPLDEAQYRAFVAALRDAQKVPAHSFEEPRYFEACLPIEVLAARGDDVLAFGPMKPVGLVDPRTGRRPYAVVQLRLENREGTAYNLVGFQTKLTYGEQSRIFRTIPGLEHAEFLRLGSVHRNTYLDSPRLLDERLMLRSHPGIHFAGQITGVEGYVESAAVGLYVGLLLGCEAQRRAIPPPPRTTALGAMLAHLREGSPHGAFVPQNIHWGLFSRLEPAKERLRKRLPKVQARAPYVARAHADLDAWRSILRGSRAPRPSAPLDARAL
jgi:methylenetetrahydrofolate--tRNA-(uracil-5-)-methyltransferase